MSGYVKRAQLAMEEYHGKSRASRLQAKVLEEAEKQAQIGGIARAAVLTSSRMAKLKVRREKKWSCIVLYMFVLRKVLNVQRKRNSRALWHIVLRWMSLPRSRTNCIVCVCPVF